MIDPLSELLAPYRNALSGQEIRLSADPIYETLFSQGGSSQTQPGPLPHTKTREQDLSGLQRLAARMASKRGWGGDQLDALIELVQRESSWDPSADNPTSTAYGLFQFLDSTRDNYGIGLNASPKKQIRAGLDYVADRYGDPLSALQFHSREGWY
jgi:hypothetical protein